LPENHRYLFKNLADNGLFDIEVYPVGLSSRPGLKRIYGSGAVASFLPAWHAATATRFAVVPVTTLDIVIAARFDGVPITIKMDVEGFEFEVLKGSERTLRLHPAPAWLVEIQLARDAAGGLNDRFYETFEIFWRQGYQSAVADAKQHPVLPM
jgi:FkbM family methyltransferase